MKTKLLLIIFLLLCTYIFAQEKKIYAKAIPDDIEIVDSIKSLCISNDYRFVVYQTGGYDKLCISSVIFLKDGDKIKYWVVLYDNSPDNNAEMDFQYSYIVKFGGELISSSIFSYTAYINTGISLKEYEEKEGSFPTPSRIDDTIFYIDPFTTFFFEFENESYKSNKFRVEWLKLIKKDLLPIFKEYCVNNWDFYKDILS